MTGPPEDVAALNDWFLQAVAETRRRQGQALDAYDRMLAADLRHVLLAEYRCRTRGCLLLRIWQTPHGRFFYHPSYTLSPEVNEAESTQEGRRQHTEPGRHRKWLPRADSLDEFLSDHGDNPNVSRDLNCEHVRVRLTGERLAEDIAAALPGSPEHIFLPDTP